MHVTRTRTFLLLITQFQKLHVQNEVAGISVRYLVYGNMTPFLDS